MDLSQRLDALIAAAADLGISVRREPLGSEGGGLCVLRGRRVLFVDASADPDSQYERTLSALAGLTEWEHRYLPPEIREDLDRAREGPAV